MTERATYALAPHLPLTLGQVKLIEADLLNILGPPELRSVLGNDAANVLDFGTALIAQAAYLRLLSRFLNEARADAKIGFDADPQANDPFLDRFRVQIEQPESGRRWARLLQSAEKQVDAARLRRVVLATVLSAVQRDASRLGLIARYLLFVLARGSVKFGEPLGRIPYRRLSSLDLQLDSPETQARFRRHFAACIDAEALLAYENLRLAHDVLLIGFGLSHWLAAAHALRASRSVPDEADWNAAFDFTNRTLGPGSDFPARLERDATLAAILDALTSRPLFPYAMARP